MLKKSDGPLASAYDVAMLDLDGVVYISGHAVAGAPQAIDAARKAGQTVVFVTNNASRTPDKVAGNLIRLGVSATPAQVVTSSQAAARMLAARFPPESAVLMLGADGLARALVEEALVPVTTPEADDVVAIVTGYGPDVVWRDVMRAAVRIGAGLPWVATNRDLTIPTSYGVAPGHGVMVRMLEQFSGVTPDVAGKPSPPLLDEAIRRTNAERALMVGDRLDTDIEGAHRSGVDSLLVLTGVTDLAQLAAAAPHQRPDYISADLAGLLDPHSAPETAGTWARSGGWEATVESGVLRMQGSGAASDWWRAAAAATWAQLDLTGVAAQVADVRPPAVGADSPAD